MKKVVCQTTKRKGSQKRLWEEQAAFVGDHVDQNLLVWFSGILNSLCIRLEGLIIKKSESQVWMKNEYRLLPMFMQQPKEKSTQYSTEARSKLELELQNTSMD